MLRDEKPVFTGSIPIYLRFFAKMAKKNPELLRRLLRHIENDGGEFFTSHERTELGKVNIFYFQTRVHEDARKMALNALEVSENDIIVKNPLLKEGQEEIYDLAEKILAHSSQ